MYLYYYSVKTPPWIGGVCESFMRWVVRFRGSSRGVSPLDRLRKLDPNEELGIRNEGGSFAEIDDEVDDEVAAVLAFVISSATFLAAQDDETGRCPKVVSKSLVIPNPCGLTYVGANHASLGCPFQRKGREDAPLRFNQRFPRAAARSRSGSRRSALSASPAFCFCVPTTGPFRRSCRRCDSGGNLRGQGFPCDGSGGRRR